MTNLASQGVGTMILLTDGTVMVLAPDYQTWNHLTPDAQGSYITGIWTKNPISSMSTPRQSFASAVLPSGKVLVLGGKRSGPGLAQNWTPTGEIFDPVANSWSATAPYPNTANCPTVSEFGGTLNAGTTIVTGVVSGVAIQPGWAISGSGLPAGTTVASATSNQIIVSAGATATGNVKLTFSVHLTGASISGSAVITGVPTSGLHVGWPVSGTGIPSGTTIASVDSSSQIHISQNATSTSAGLALTFTVNYTPAACFGDAPTMLITGGQILAGNLVSPATYIYDSASNTWAASASKIYIDKSDGEGWVKLGDGSILTYDVFQSISGNTGYAERDVFTPGSPGSFAWSSITPGAGSTGLLPLLSSTALAQQLGPMIRLQDDRILAIGANGHTAIYTPSTGAWVQGPDITNKGGHFAAEGGPAAILPNGDVLFAADAGLGATVTATVVTGSTTVTVSSTVGLQIGWTISGTNFPAGSVIVGLTSNQVIMNSNATTSGTGIPLTFSGGVSSPPTRLFVFSAATNTIAPVSTPITDTTLSSVGASQTRMLVLPNEQVLFTDSSTQLWIYTPDGAPSTALLPAVTQVVPANGGAYLLTGTQLNGQSAGASQGDGVEMDENYPVISLRSGSGAIYWARTSNWSYAGVGGGTTPQTVSFTLDPTVPIGPYALVVSGAGLSSNAFALTTGGQTITFNPLSNQTIGGAPVTISATATSGLTVSFAGLTPVVCTVSGATVTLLAVGTCTVQATQAGNSSYSVATAVNQSFLVTSKCDINQDGNTTVADVQHIVNEALGAASAVHELNKDGAVNVADVQIVIDSALGSSCAAK